MLVNCASYEQCTSNIVHPKHTIHTLHPTNREPRSAVDQNSIFSGFSPPDCNSLETINASEGKKCNLNFKAMTTEINYTFSATRRCKRGRFRSLPLLGALSAGCTFHRNCFPRVTILRFAYFARSNHCGRVFHVVRR